MKWLIIIIIKTNGNKGITKTLRILFPYYEFLTANYCRSRLLILNKNLSPSKPFPAARYHCIYKSKEWDTIPDIYPRILTEFHPVKVRRRDERSTEKKYARMKWRKDFVEDIEKSGKINKTKSWSMKTRKEKVKKAMRTIYKKKKKKRRRVSRIQWQSTNNAKRGKSLRVETRDKKYRKRCESQPERKKIEETERQKDWGNEIKNGKEGTYYNGGKWWGTESPAGWTERRTGFGSDVTLQRPRTSSFFYLTRTRKLQETRAIKRRVGTTSFAVVLYNSGKSKAEQCELNENDVGTRYVVTEDETNVVKKVVKNLEEETTRRNFVFRTKQLLPTSRGQLKRGSIFEIFIFSGQSFWVIDLSGVSIKTPLVYFKKKISRLLTLVSVVVNSF